MVTTPYGTRDSEIEHFVDSTVLSKHPWRYTLTDVGELIFGNPNKEAAMRLPENDG